MILGQIIAGIYIALTQSSYNRKLDANHGIPVPEWRLPPVIIGGVSFALGLFWFGWSGYRSDVHWIVPTLSGKYTYALSIIHGERRESVLTLKHRFVHRLRAACHILASP